MKYGSRLIALAAVLATPPARTTLADSVLWGLSSENPAKLYTIDPATGNATFETELNGRANLTGLSFVDQVLHGSNVNHFPGGSGTADLGTIDTANGVITFVNNQDGSINWHGLASNESTGELYSIDLSDDFKLKVTDAGTGLVTIVGPGTGVSGRGMAYDDSNGILYATAGNSTLHTVNTSTGLSTLVGPFGFSAGLWVGLAYDEDTETLYLNVGASVGELYTVDVNTGAATLVGSNNFLEIDGLAWSPPAPCPWDCGEINGTIDTVDFLTLLSQWGQTGTTCDFGGDGVDTLDFLDLLAHWGPCP